jgi:MFS family permease
MNTRTVRQYAQFIAFGGGVMFLNICSYTKGKYAAYACIIVAQFCLGASQSGLLCCYLDIAPNYSSILSSIGNALGSLAGIIGPLVVAIFINKYEGVNGWRATFLLTAALTVLTLLLWVIYQTSTIDPYINTPRSRNTDKDDKNDKEKKINY